MQLIWNVYFYDFNSNEITSFNIFEHHRFYEETINCLKDCRDKNEFKTELRRELFYYFGYKVEYEIFITEPFPYVTKEEIDRLVAENTKRFIHVDLKVGDKIDIYQQVMLNYDRFIDYIWGQKEIILHG